MPICEPCAPQSQCSHGESSALSSTNVDDQPYDNSLASLLAPVIRAFASPKVFNVLRLAMPKPNNKMLAATVNVPTAHLEM